MLLLKDTEKFAVEIMPTIQDQSDSLPLLTIEQWVVDGVLIEKAEPNNQGTYLFKHDPRFQVKLDVVIH